MNGQPKQARKATLEDVDKRVGTLTATVDQLQRELAQQAQITTQLILLGFALAGAYAIALIIVRGHDRALRELAGG